LPLATVRHHRTKNICRSSLTIPGIPSLWTGLSASILRQGTYSTARFGLHNFFSTQLLKRTGEQKLSVWSNIACAGLAGGIAGLIGNPAEVVLVRVCADGAKPVGERFAYRNVGEALVRTGREEGLQAFTKGITANITRSVLMSEYYLWKDLGRGDG
jgi:dicarboxylate transporter 10